MSKICQKYVPHTGLSILTVRGCSSGFSARTLTWNLKLTGLSGKGQGPGDGVGAQFQGWRGATDFRPEWAGSRTAAPTPPGGPSGTGAHNGGRAKVLPPLRSSRGPVGECPGWSVGFWGARGPGWVAWDQPRPERVRAKSAWPMTVPLQE